MVAAARVRFLHLHAGSGSGLNILQALKSQVRACNSWRALAAALAIYKIHPSSSPEQLPVAPVLLTCPNWFGTSSQDSQGACLIKLPGAANI